MDLQKIRKQGIRIGCEASDLDAYRRDLWPRDTLLLAQGKRPARPDVVAWPQTADEVAVLLEWAQNQGLAVIPYGAGSGVCGGAAGRQGALVIDTKRMAGLHLEAQSRRARAGAGMLGQHLEDALGVHGWTTGHSPSSIMCSTVGGYVAARSAGQFSSQYGVFEDRLLNVELVTPTGVQQIGVHGPRSTRWMLPVVCGSEGGLGVVTQATLRLDPVPEAHWFRGLAFDGVDQALEAVRGLMQADLKPFAVRLYDPVDTKVGGKLGDGDPGSFKELARAATRSPVLMRHLASLPLALPKLVNRLAQGASQRVLLILAFAGTEEEVAEQSARAGEHLQNGEDLGPGPGERWFAHRHAVSYKMSTVFAHGHFADTMEVAATWAGIGRLYAMVGKAIGQHAAVMAHFSHAYPEGCSIYFTFVGRGDVAVYDRVWQAALVAAQQAGGTVTHHHGVGQLKRDAAQSELGSAVGLWQQIKAGHDPDGIMNPGIPFGSGPASLVGGSSPQVEDAPVGVDPISRLAWVDAHAEPGVVCAGLHQDGWGLRMRPNRPYDRWLRDFDPTSVGPLDKPVFGVEGRQGESRVRLGVAPRSAAGPDLRLALARMGHIDRVQVPVIRGPSSRPLPAWRRK